MVYDLYHLFNIHHLKLYCFLNCNTDFNLNRSTWELELTMLSVWYLAVPVVKRVGSFIKLVVVMLCFRFILLITLSHAPCGCIVVETPF